MPQLRLKDYLVIVGGILLLALSLSFAHVNAVDSAPPGPFVTVVNTPLPVTLQGTSLSREPWQPRRAARGTSGSPVLLM